jgi:hypothetical protein
MKKTTVMIMGEEGESPAEAAIGQEEGENVASAIPSGAVPRTESEDFLVMQDQFLTTMYHQRLPMSQLTSITVEDAQRGIALFEQLREYYDTMFNRYNNHLRTPSTQRRQRR